jgi:hypothetical protein
METIRKMRFSVERERLQSWGGAEWRVLGSEDRKQPLILILMVFRFLLTSDADKRSAAG